MNFYRIVDQQISTKCVNIKGSNLTYLEPHQNVTLYTISGSNEQKWGIKVFSPTVSTNVLSAVDTSFGFNVNRNQGDYYYNCDVLKVAGNEKDAAVLFVPVFVPHQIGQLSGLLSHSARNIYMEQILNGHCTIKARINCGNLFRSESVVAILHPVCISLAEMLIKFRFLQTMTRPLLQDT